MRGHAVNNRLTRIAIDSGTVTAFDLNPGVDYTTLPNLAAQATALAQPTATVCDPIGEFFYVAAFGTNRIARVDANGKILARIEVSPFAGSAANPRTKRGPRDLALHATAQRLYVLNRIRHFMVATRQA